MSAKLEHLNVTVPDPDTTAALLIDLFGWHIRWDGEALGSGRTVHVGTDTAYIALYTPKTDLADPPSSYQTRAGLNHIGIVVDDLAAAEAKVTARGFSPHSHADYEPGRRFYFDTPDGVEFEIVSYD